MESGVGPAVHTQAGPPAECGGRVSGWVHGKKLGQGLVGEGAGSQMSPWVGPLVGSQLSLEDGCVGCSSGGSGMGLWLGSQGGVHRKSCGLVDPWIGPEAGPAVEPLWGIKGLDCTSGLVLV